MRLDGRLCIDQFHFIQFKIGAPAMGVAVESDEDNRHRDKAERVDNHQRRHLIDFNHRLNRAVRKMNLQACAGEHFDQHAEQKLERIDIKQNHENREQKIIQLQIYELQTVEGS